MTASLSTLTAQAESVIVWFMAALQLGTIEAPLDRPSLASPAVGLARRASALGLLRDGPVDQLDMALVRRIARQAFTAGIGVDAATALLHGIETRGQLGALMQRLDDALSASPLPDREVPELLDVFDRDDLAALLGTSGVSLGRYLAGTRAWPDMLAFRIHWLALVVSDLSGAYNGFGVRRWFDRSRSQLGDRSPRQVLGTDWDPDDAEVERVRRLAASLAGVGAAT